MKKTREFSNVFETNVEITLFTYIYEISVSRTNHNYLSTLRERLLKIVTYMDWFVEISETGFNIPIFLQLSEKTLQSIKHGVLT